jgi:hypothetical protein
LKEMAPQGFNGYGSCDDTVASDDEYSDGNGNMPSSKSSNKKGNRFKKTQKGSSSDTDMLLTKIAEQDEMIMSLLMRLMEKEDKSKSDCHCSFGVLLALKSAERPAESLDINGNVKVIGQYNDRVFGWHKRDTNAYPRIGMKVLQTERWVFPRYMDEGGPDAIFPRSPGEVHNMTHDEVTAFVNWYNITSYNGIEDENRAITHRRRYIRNWIEKW